MKILHVYKDFDPPVHGGIERHMALMCKHQRQWAEVEALVCSRSRCTSQREWEGIPITEVGEWRRFQGAPVSPAFPRLLKQRAADADVVVVHMPNPTAELSWLWAKPKARLVVRYHSDVVRQAAAMKIYGAFQQRFLSKADLILPTSQIYLDHSKTLQPFKDRCQVIPLGIEYDSFQQFDPNTVAALKDRYGGNYVLYAGRHRYYKGLSYLVEAAKKIDAKVVIAGDGPMRKALEGEAASLGVEIAFPGALSQEDLVAHLHGCAVFAFPSIARSEAFGLSMLEAQACGKPVVATRLGTGVEWVNEDGKTGMNVLPRDANALASAVNTLLADANMRETMGDYARDRVRRDFNVETVAKQEFDAYQDGIT